MRPEEMPSRAPAVAVTVVATTFAAAEVEPVSEEIGSFTRSRGLHRRRARTPLAFSPAFLKGECSRPDELPGFGRYGSMEATGKAYVMWIVEAAGVLYVVCAMLYNVKYGMLYAIPHFTIQ